MTAPAGSIGGVAEACCLQPMDVIKTRLQLDKAKQYTGGARNLCRMLQGFPSPAFWHLGHAPFGHMICA
jgi:solute carrier family 25 citrate transporter 1